MTKSFLFMTTSPSKCLARRQVALDVVAQSPLRMVPARGSLVLSRSLDVVAQQKITGTCRPILSLGAIPPEPVWRPGVFSERGRCRHRGGRTHQHAEPDTPHDPREIFRPVRRSARLHQRAILFRPSRCED